jgi:hypothetical protein
MCLCFVHDIKLKNKLNILIQLKMELLDYIDNISKRHHLLRQNYFPV